MTADDLEATPSGFKVKQWSLSLGEQLARDRLPFLPRALRIESVRGALRASAVMLALWRAAPDAPRAALKDDGATALHLAAKYQARVAPIAARMHATYSGRALTVAREDRAMSFHHVFAVSHSTLAMWM
jgi:hypothetical protein